MKKLLPTFDLSLLTVDNLRKVAKQCNIKGITKMRKAQLIQAISKNPLAETQFTSFTQPLTQPLFRNKRQSHGFTFEQYIINRFNLEKINGYTAEYDATDENGTPVSIKYIKEKGSIEMGDYFRNARKKENFILFIGFWKFINNTRQTTRIYRFEIDQPQWVQMFQFEHALAMKTEMKYITCLRADDDRWKEYCDRYKKLWNARARNCRIRFKKENKTQKRIQCALNQKDFLTMKRNFNYNLIE